MKPLGIKVKVALATSITSIVMIAVVTVLQAQRLREDFTKVMFAQQKRHRHPHRRGAGRQADRLAGRDQPDRAQATTPLAGRSSRAARVV